jgi:two-component system NtrC family sensor kinase
VPFDRARPKETSETSGTLETKRVQGEASGYRRSVRLVVKVLLVLLFVAVLPVTVSGISAMLAARRAVASAAATSLEAEARHLSELAETTILGSLDHLKQASLLGLSSLSPEERPGALWVIYRADAARTAVVLLDGATRGSITAPVYQSTVSTEPGLVDHEAFPAAALPLFAAHVPLDEALAAGRAVGVPYIDKTRGAPFVVLAVKVQGPVVDGKETPWIVAVELSLRRLNERFVEASGEGLTAFLTDGEGRVVCHPDDQQMTTRAPLVSHQGVAPLLSASAADSGVVNLDDDDDATLVAFARLNRFAHARGSTWGVVVEQDRALALSGVAVVLRQLLVWIVAALVLAVVASLILARGIVGPIELLTRVVSRYAAGHEAHAQVRAPALGNDELGSLGRAFNSMADSIESRDQQLRRFTEELQQKVDERTAELKDAQAQLIESQKMAAIGELGASVAHEINNPLAAVLGSAQIALLRTDRSDKVRAHLEDIEKESLRIKDIVEDLLRLSQDRARHELDLLDPTAVVEAALALVHHHAASCQVGVRKELAPALPQIRGRSSDLQQAMRLILTNAIEAMPEGGVVTVKTDVLDDALVRIFIEDTGPGLDPSMKDRAFEPFFTTRAASGHRGMGLSIVQRIVQEHHGRIILESAGQQRGTIAKLSFPVARAERRLA